MVTSTTDTTKKKTTTEDPAQTSQNTATQDQANSSAQQNAVGGSTAQTNTTVRPSDGVSGTVVGGQQKVETPAPAAVTTPTAENKNYITADYINNFYKQMQDQSAAMNQYTVDKAVQELQRAQEDAQAGFRQQQNQVNVDEAQARDAHVLYAAARGDRGGITARQYDSIANTAAKNRQGIQTAQQKLATDTARQIADLRAQGEFEQANNVLQIAQQQLAHLWQLQQEEADNAARDKQFALQEANLTGKYNGEKTYAAQEAERSWAYDIAMKNIQMGIVPDESVLAAAGLDAEQAKMMAYIYAQSSGNQQFIDQYNAQNGVTGALGSVAGALGGTGSWLSGLLGGSSNNGAWASGSTGRVQGAGHGSGSSSKVDYDPNVDYQALINEAVANNDPEAAAKYEQQRNAKIADMNKAGTNTEGYKQTNDHAITTRTYGGVTYDKAVDYQALINQAVLEGDYESAAQYEKLRNAKINDMSDKKKESLGVQTTNIYSSGTGASFQGVSFDPSVDYQALINEAVAEGNYAAAMRYERQKNAKLGAMQAQGIDTGGQQQTHIYRNTGAVYDGVSFDPNENYQALIEEALANNDTASATLYEQMRNAKVGAMNALGQNSGNYLQTNVLTGDGSMSDTVAAPTPQPQYNYEPDAQKTMSDDEFAARLAGIMNVTNTATGSAYADALYKDTLNQGNLTAAQKAELERVKQLVDANLNGVNNYK